MLPEEVAKLIGKTGDTAILEVEKGAIKKLADAVGDSNPLYWDEGYARASRYGSIIAPPGFFGWPVKWKGNMPLLLPLRQEVVDTIAKAGYERILDAGIEYDFLHPVYAGDVLASVPKVISITERETKGGKMLFSVIEITYINQNADIVAKARQTLAHR